MFKSNYIVLQGLDGSGKSTLSRILAEELSTNYETKIVPFHKWLFSHKLKSFFAVPLVHCCLTMNENIVVTPSTPPP